MNVRRDPSVAKRPKDPRRSRSVKPRIQDTEWEATDTQLDEALRQTFPASDALTITQYVPGS